MTSVTEKYSRRERPDIMVLVLLPSCGLLSLALTCFNQRNGLQHDDISLRVAVLENPLHTSPLDV